MPRRIFRGLVVVLLLAACTPARTPEASQPAPSPAPATSSGSEARWNALIEAARQEGRVVVSGPPTPETRQSLPIRFRERFGIELEYLALGSTGDLLTKLEAERGSGLYTVDVIMGGAQSMYTKAYEDKLLDPIKPILVHPEALDGSKWVSGKVWFMDPGEEYILRLSNYVTTQITVNEEYVKATEITRWSDLLEPRFQGKISAYDPLRSGSGWNTADYLMVNLGEDYVKRLYADQNPGISRDFRQLSDWLARGTYPVSLSLRQADFQSLQAEGFKAAIVPSPTEIPTAVTAGFGLGGLVNQAPHPKAAQLFLNWIATKEGQEAWHSSEKTVSVRTDVKNEWARSNDIPQPGAPIFDTHGWDYTLENRNPVRLERLKQLVGSG